MLFDRCRTRDAFRATIINVVPGQTKRVFRFFTKIVQHPQVTIRIEDADYQKLETDIFSCPPQTFSFPWKKDGPEPKAGDRILMHRKLAYGR